MFRTNIVSGSVSRIANLITDRIVIHPQTGLQAGLQVDYVLDYMWIMNWILQELQLD